MRHERIAMMLSWPEKLRCCGFDANLLAAALPHDPIDSAFYCCPGPWSCSQISVHYVIGR